MPSYSPPAISFSPETYRCLARLIQILNSYYGVYKVDFGGGTP